MLKILDRIKASVKRSLDRMARENQKQFGGGIPDCCKMNRPADNRPEKYRG
ncbi:LDCC motif putative metal-binding protein [Caproiciproducens sp.]|uniref:LDCC motif putative metal-binding protein n=1 Tax=Caproiciproducens sp. TaxID=1954376 RepID=UPI0028A26D9D|nr:LDCC motif putative metal-binding protein [Caproiciproducens sp.]